MTRNGVLDPIRFIPLPGEWLGRLVADVIGHGIDSALLMAETRAVLRATAQTSSEPSEIRGVVSRVLHGDTEPHRFATLLLATLHVPSAALAYSSAGPSVRLPAGCRRRGEGRAAVDRLFRDSRYETCAGLRLEAGEALLLLTDGVTDCLTRDCPRDGRTRLGSFSPPSRARSEIAIVAGFAACARR